MYVAMKAGDKIRTKTLRILLSTLKEEQIGKKENINDNWVRGGLPTRELSKY